MKLFKISLAFQMAIATALGILCGLFLGDLCDIFAPYASAYIMILKITAVPYLIGAIIHGIGQLSSTQAKQILKKGIFFIALAWSINLMLIYAILYLFPQPSTVQTGGYISNETAQLNFADLLIPDNIFYDLTNNIVPAIVIFSLLIGIALISIKDKDIIIKGVGDLVAALTKATSWIARITPWGTFLIIANQVGTIQLSTVKQVSSYIILYIICICVLVFWIFPKLVSMLTSIPSYRWLQQLMPILILAYTTNVVIVCLPYIIELLKKETAQVDPHDDKAQNQIQGTVSVVFNIPLGSLFIMAFVFFISIRYGSPLSLIAQMKLFVGTCLNGLGAVGLGSWINSLTFTLDVLGLPQEAINLYLTTLPFTSGFQSMISVMEIAALSLFITLACRNMLTLNLTKIVKQGLFTLGPVLLLFSGIKLWNPLPEIKNETKSIYELNISSAIPVKVNTTQPSSSSREEDTFDRILRTKTIRVGYDTQVAPFCFLNIDHQIVGYDISFAYELAYDLGCQLELVPLHYHDLINELNDHRYDIAMSSISINETRLKALTFTEPYLCAKFCFVVQEHMKKTFSTIDSIYKDKRIKIAALKGSSFETVAKELFPQIPLILLNTYADFSLNDPYVALLWEEQEAIAWTLHHRHHRIVLPQPELGVDTLSYAIRDDSPRFINYLNQWLKLKQTQGFTERQYDLWVKGRTEIAAPNEPRWSVVRNVLHWVD